MILIGSHVSFNSKEQLFGSVKEAISYNENTFMFYTGAPQNTKRCKIDSNLTNKGLVLLKENNIDINNLVIHAPYIINLANNLKPDSYNFAINFLKEEIKRAEELGINKIVLHPGNFVSLDIDTGIKNIINGLNKALNNSQKVYVCLETMAGKGTEVGFKLEHIKRIIDGCIYSDKLKVCLDTCHLNDAGYDISLFESFLDKFDKLIGIDKIGCVHVNDSKNVRGAGKDRHENIGFGTIGFDNLLNVIYNKRLSNIPMILETPYTRDDKGNDKVYSPYKFEIDMIRRKKFNPNLYEDIIKFNK